MNKFVGIGRITKDLELRYSQSGTAFMNFGIAINRKYAKTDPKVDFFNATAFNKTAEFLSKHMSKGSQIGFEGRLQNDTYEKDGEKRYKTTIMIDDVYFADSKKDSGGDAYEPSKSENDGFIPMDDGDELPF